SPSIYISDAGQFVDPNPGHAFEASSEQQASRQVTRPIAQSIRAVYVVPIVQAGSNNFGIKLRKSRSQQALVFKTLCCNKIREVQ
ncbi:hypothetical protein ACLOJK_026972, partial [Asimina triloba]